MSCTPLFSFRHGPRMFPITIDRHGVPVYYLISPPKATAMFSFHGYVSDEDLEAALDEQDQWIKEQEEQLEAFADWHDHPSLTAQERNPNLK